MVESRAFRTDEPEEYRNDQVAEVSSKDSAEKLLSKEEFFKILKSQYKQVDYIGFDTVGTKEFYLFVTRK